MNRSDWRLIALLLFLSALSAGLHWSYFVFASATDISRFHYNIFELYGYFCGFSLVIIIVLIRMRKTNIDSVGNTFMLLTCVKMFVAYLLLRPLLEQAGKQALPEKISFFVVFAVFLTIETILSIRLLNKS